METKLTVRVPKELLQGAKHYAEENETTLTRLITAYLQRLTEESVSLQGAPVVRRLSGALSPDISEADYREYLERKYRGE